MCGLYLGVPETGANVRTFPNQPPSQGHLLHQVIVFTVFLVSKSPGFHEDAPSPMVADGVHGIPRNSSSFLMGSWDPFVEAWNPQGWSFAKKNTLKILRVRSGRYKKIWSPIQLQYPILMVSIVSRFKELSHSRSRPKLLACAIRLIRSRSQTRTSVACEGSLSQQICCSNNRSLGHWETGCLWLSNVKGYTIHYTSCSTVLQWTVLM